MVERPRASDTRLRAGSRGVGSENKREKSSVEQCNADEDAGRPFHSAPGPMEDVFSPSLAETARDCEGMGGKRCEEKGRFPILSVKWVG
jgi:hypothetical protein